MKIFIDSTVTVMDPFMKNNFNGALLQIAEEGFIEIIISKVVIDETRNKLEMHLREKSNSVSKNIHDLNKFLKDSLIDDIELNIENVMLQFDAFYNTLKETGIIDIVEYDNNILPTLVERSIKRIKPFSERKQEFRDGIIWLTYAQIAEKGTDEVCFMITSNTEDYFDEEKKELHPILVNDTNKIKLYKTVKELITSETELIELKDHVEAIKFIDSINFDDTFVLQSINQNFLEELFSELKSISENTQPYEISDKYFELGYINVELLDIKTIDDIDTAIIGNKILVGGTLTVPAYVEVYEYNPNYDIRGDKYNYSDSESIEIEVEFSFAYSSKGIPSDFEVDKYWIKKRSV